MAHLSISLLGPFQVSLDNRPVTGFDSNKVRALLAYLAVEADRPHQRDALAALLWSERPNRAARNSLRHALSNLRTAIGDRDADTPHLTVNQETVQFNCTGECRVDVRAFRTLASDPPPVFTRRGSIPDARR